MRDREREEERDKERKRERIEKEREVTAAIYQVIQSTLFSLNFR